jgi:hypothetical protein
LFTADTVEGLYSTSGGYYEVAGLHVVNGDSLVLAVSWPNAVVVGESYTLDNAAIGYTDSAHNYYAGPGTGHGIFILSLLDNSSNRVMGSFSGVLYEQNTGDSLTISNAQFNTNFVVY